MEILSRQWMCRSDSSRNLLDFDVKDKQRQQFMLHMARSVETATNISSNLKALFCCRRLLGRSKDKFHNITWNTARGRRRGGRDTPPLFFILSALDGVGGQLQALVALSHGKRPDNNCTGGWVGFWAGLDMWEKFRSYCVSNPVPYGPQQVAIMCELSRPECQVMIEEIIYKLILKFRTGWWIVDSFMLRQVYLQDKTDVPTLYEGGWTPD